MPPFRRPLAALVLASAALLAGAASVRPQSRAGQVTVMTRNVYVGADVDAVIDALASADQSDDLAAIRAAVETIQRTDFPARAAAIADEIARHRPHVVGLQEITVLGIDLSAAGLPAVVDLDFLSILEAALARRGLRYTVAASIRNTDAAPMPGIRLVDFDVMLVDADRVTVVGPPVARNFARNLGAVAPRVELLRGYVAVRATVNGATLLFVNTHLESGSTQLHGEVRLAQASELAGFVDGEPAVVLMGDLNARPASPVLRVLGQAGLRDVWADLRPRESGFTCCHADDLANQRPTLAARIDYVLARGLTPGAGASVSLLGVLPAERIQGPAGLLWPSDHAGVLATLPLPGATRN